MTDYHVTLEEIRAMIDSLNEEREEEVKYWCPRCGKLENFNRIEQHLEECNGTD